MTKCGACAKQKSSFVMSNRFICLHCDELLFDIEIECEDESLGAQPSDLTKRIRKTKDTAEDLKNQN